MPKVDPVFLTPSKGPTCKVATVLAALPVEQRRKLAVALKDPSVTHASIERVTRLWGQPVSDTAIHKHRKGGCACGT